MPVTPNTRGYPLSREFFGERKVYGAQVRGAVSVSAGAGAVTR